MSTPLDDIGSYSRFVYALAERHSFVTHSTLILAPIGATLARLEGGSSVRAAFTWKFGNWLISRRGRFGLTATKCIGRGKKSAGMTHGSILRFPRWPSPFRIINTGRPIYATTVCRHRASVSSPRTWMSFWKMCGRSGWKECEFFSVARPGSTNFVLFCGRWPPITGTPRSRTAKVFD